MGVEYVFESNESIVDVVVSTDDRFQDGIDKLKELYDKIGDVRFSESSLDNFDDLPDEDESYDIDDVDADESFEDVLDPVEMAASEYIDAYQEFNDGHSMAVGDIIDMVMDL